MWTCERGAGGGGGGVQNLLLQMRRKAAAVPKHQCPDWNGNVEQEVAVLMGRLLGVSPQLVLT